MHTFCQLGGHVPTLLASKSQQCQRLHQDLQIKQAKRSFRAIEACKVEIKDREDLPITYQRPDGAHLTLRSPKHSAMSDSNQRGKKVEDAALHFKVLRRK